MKKEKDWNIKNVKTLDDCMDFVIEAVEEDNLEEWTKLEENTAIAQAHHNIGRSIRNSLELWHNGPPVKYFNNLGIYHADDMSSIILISLHRKYNNKELDVEGQAKHYIDYWEKVDPKVNKGKK